MPLPSGTTEVASTPSLATRGLRTGDYGPRQQALREQADRAARRPQAAQQVAPRRSELERVVEVLAGREVRASPSRFGARKARSGEELVREADVVARLRGRRAGRLRRGMDAVRRQPVVVRADAARRRLREPQDELEVEEVVAALVERTRELEPA